jgi:hypothetical protein
MSAAGTDEWNITIDTAFTGIAVGHYIFPQALNMQKYVDAALTAFSLLGPGELSANPSALQRGSRKPRPQSSWPYTIDGAFTKRIQDAGDEVQRADISYLFTAFLVPITLSSPPVPMGLEAPPYIYVPRNLGFYQA